MAHIEPVLHIDAMPLMLGAAPEPHNGGGLPDALPFTLGIDAETALLVQVPDPQVNEALDSAYRSGSLLGTAMDDSEIGIGYCEDFLGFIERVADRPLTRASILEIGAGRGYLLRRLGELGANAVGLEPGLSNAAHWKRHGVSVVPEAFPSTSCAGPYDVIVSYAVLEHATDAAGFLHQVSQHLTSGGLAVFAVPNNEPDIYAGDPAMLVHEHFAYFTRGCLRRVLQRAGLDVIALERSGYGGALYAAVRVGAVPVEVPSPSESALAAAYADRWATTREAFAAALRRADSRGQSIGLYAPARAVNLLPESSSVRFFDDDPSLHGRFYPPLPARVEPRSALLSNPPDEVWIMSRTFGARLQAVLADVRELSRTRVRTIADLLGEAVQ